MKIWLYVALPPLRAPGCCAGLAGVMVRVVNNLIRCSLSESVAWLGIEPRLDGLWDPGITKILAQPIWHASRNRAKGRVEIIVVGTGGVEPLLSNRPRFYRPSEQPVARVPMGEDIRFQRMVLIAESFLFQNECIMRSANLPNWR